MRHAQTHSLCRQSTSCTVNYFSSGPGGDGYSNVGVWRTPMFFGAEVWREERGGLPQLYTQRAAHVHPFGR